MNPETKLQTVIEELRDSSTEVKLYTLWEADGYTQLKNDPEVDSEESLQSIKLMNQHYIDLGFPENIVTDNDEGTLPLILGSKKFNKKKKVYNSVAILECLANGLPVLTNHNVPWANIKKMNAGWYIPCNNSILGHTLKKIFKLKPKDFFIKSKNSYVLAQKFNWNIVRTDYISTYTKLLENK